MKNICILKSSPSYLIFSCEDRGLSRVYKIAHQDNQKLIQEVQRIRELRAAYPSLRARLPQIYDHGLFESGTHAGKAYYIQEHLSGATFSHHVQDSASRADLLDRAFRDVFRTLVDITEEHHLHAAYHALSGRFLKEAILFEYKRLRSLKNISYIASGDVVVNDVSYTSLESLMRELFSSTLFQDLDRGVSSIATLGHWNFHGDNVIVPVLEAPASFKVIDPDVSIDRSDPLYGIARFLYSFPHDTVEYEQYVIHSEIFARSSENHRTFRVTYLWPGAVQDNYERLFGPIYYGDTAYLSGIDPRFNQQTTLLRLRLCMLQCLLRGVYANHDEEVSFVQCEIDQFRNKSIYLYLQAVMFANKLAAAYRV